MLSTIKPRIRGFICLSSHPEGCKANVAQQIDYVKSQGEVSNAPKRVLIIGASTGYGLASRISTAFAGGASTIGVFFEKAAEGKRTATAGWYNSAAFHEFADDAGLYAKSFNGDAFSQEMKRAVIETIKQDLGQIDLIVYSLGAPRRVHPVTGEMHHSTLKPIGKSVETQTLDTDKKIVKPIALEAATQQEIDDTVAVMGGEDWQMWIDALSEAGVLAEGCNTTAYTYLGEKITWDIYWDGTIGSAKKDLDEKVKTIATKLQANGGDAFVSVLKAVVTQSSSAIPIMPLYLSLLFKVMKEDGSHEGCIEQVYGLMQKLYSDNPETDDARRLRMDQREMQAHVQKSVEDLWPQVTTENIDELTDFECYQQEFLKLFGFGLNGVDYEAEVETEKAISNVVNV